MKKVKTLTHILFPLFVGLIIGGAVSGNIALLIWSIILLVADIIVGIVLQYLIEKRDRDDEFDSLFYEENRAMANDSVDTVKQNTGKKMCDKFNSIYTSLKSNGGARLINSINSDVAGEFLLDLCSQMPHAPLPYTLTRLSAVFVEDLNGYHSVVYAFEYYPNSICQNVFIFLVNTKKEEIRFFTVETDFSTFCLCEYAGDMHINYGSVELNNIPERIKEILQ